MLKYYTIRYIYGQYLNSMKDIIVYDEYDKNKNTAR